MIRYLQDEHETRAVGERLAAGITPGLRIFLRGDLGAGKTTLVRGLLAGLGYVGKVKSPTYTLVELYPFSRLDLYHFDFYRLRGSGELEDMGFREYFNARSVCVVEWPEKGGDVLGAPDIELVLQVQENGRLLDAQAQSEQGARCLDRL